MKKKKLCKRKEKIYTGLIIILIFVVFFMSGCIEDKERIEKGSVVKLYLTGNYFINGSIEYFQVGDGKYSFEDEIIGMKSGDKKKFNYDDPITVRLIHEPEENTTYVVSGGLYLIYDRQGQIKVFNVTDTEFFIGHKLAGEHLKFNIKIKNVSNAFYGRKTCLSKHNLSGYLIFLYANNCRWSVKMKPWVEEMENNTYKFLWIDANDSEKVKIAQECLSDVLDFRDWGIPQFGCTSNGKLQIGTFMDIDEMKNFSIDCKKAVEEQQTVYENISPELKIKKGDLLVVEYIGKLLNGEVFDNVTTKFVVGSGDVIQGLDDAVIGMKINESKTIEVPPEKAYGFPEVKPIAVGEISIHSFKQTFNEEPMLNKKYTNDQSSWPGPWPVKIVEIKTKKYDYMIEILDIKKHT